MELTPRVHSIPAAAGFLTGPLAPNVYLVMDSGQGALIDAGYAGEGSVQARLEYLRGIPELKLAYIVLTHHHIDHASGAHRLRQATGARICLHPREERILRDWQADIPQDVDLPPARSLEERLRAWRRAAAQATADRLVDDGDIIAVGGVTIEVVHTPGHTLGSICLYLREERALFTGDTVLGLGTVAIAPPPHGDMGLYIESLERLKTYDAALLCPGHGPPVHDVGRKLQELIDHRHERERQILRALGRGRGTLKALLDDIYPELDRRLVNMARGQVLAHLAKLEGEGRVATREEGGETVYGVSDRLPAG
jgi:glyoxylase-like metal-dependent hydrolase (beta-lactamase superfamily II)